MAEVQFLFDNQLIAELEKLIKESQNKLLLVSPFIDLDRRIQEALREKLNKHDFELKILFGKNEGQVYKSIKKDSLEFLKQFPNIEIRYNEHLHAKFYLNDFKFIMTSLNLYDYSLAKNIEVGIIGTYASKGLLGKVNDGLTNVLSQGVDFVDQNVFGSGKEINPIEQFRFIFNSSELRFKTQPNVILKTGVAGALGYKELNGFDVIVDTLTNNEVKTPTPEVIQNKNAIANKNTASTPMTAGNHKPLSASQIAKSAGLAASEVSKIMQKAGLIDGDAITQLGSSKGLVKKNYMGNDYIAYPEDLDQVKALLRK